jgi:hypothetical protein
MERWIKNGIRGKGELPPMAGNWKGPVVIMGSARCLYDDLQHVPSNAHVMAVSMAGLMYPMNKHHWVSFHPDDFTHLLWFDKYNFSQKDHIYTHSTRDAAVVWDFDDPTLGNGTSTLLATLIAIVLGYVPIILAGVPLDGTGNIHHPPGYVTNDWDNGSCHEKWLEYRPLLVNRVFSMSGFTREMLGALPGI